MQGRGQLASPAEADRKQCTLCAGAPATFVPGAVNQWFKRYATANKQRADALGRIELVTGDRQQIDAEFVHIGRNLADGLGGVGVKQNAVLARDSGAIPRSAGWCRPRCWRA